MFYHERLHCYIRLKEVAKQLLNKSAHWPNGHHFLVDQLKRALCSGILNLVEGNHRKSVKERARFFETSRASLSEVAAIVDMANLLNLITNQDQTIYKSELLQITKMIAKLRPSWS